MILSQTCETKLRYGHQSTNALPAFSTGLPHELYLKKRTTHSRFLPDPSLYSRLPNSAARPSLATPASLSQGSTPFAAPDVEEVI